MMTGKGLSNKTFKRLEMVSSQVLFHLFIFYKLVLSVLKLPYYAAKNYQLFLDRFKVLVDGFINLEKEFQSKIKMLDFNELQEFLKGDHPHVHLNFASQYGNISLMEALIISYIVETTKPKKIFEIGTFDGFSTYHLAMNSHSSAEIYTINLPMNDEHTKENIIRLSWLEYFGDNSTHTALKKSKIGAIYKRCPQGGKVQQLFGDTLTYDFSEFKEKIDLCFIDGGHSHECLVKDTSNAMDMLSERGVVIWQDFNMQHRDIYKFMMKLSKQHKLFWIKDTRLVFYRKG